MILFKINYSTFDINFKKISYGSGWYYSVDYRFYCPNGYCDCSKGTLN